MTDASSSTARTQTEPAQYLTFTLDGEVFATEIEKVREVLEYRDVTKVPRTPDFMRGVLNLRGNVVPVVDPRLQFGMEQAEPTIDTCIVIVEVRIDDESTLLGAIADSVQEVIDLDASQLEPPPRLGTRVHTDFIRAMGKHHDGFVIILDMDRVFRDEQLARVLSTREMSAATGEADTNNRTEPFDDGASEGE